MSLGSRLKKSRVKMGFSQEYVARRVNLHRTTIGKYESDECVPSVDILSRLIEIYCEDANYILYGKTRKNINVSDLSEFTIQKIYFLIAKYRFDEKTNIKK